MALERLLRVLTETLASAGITSMLTGSVAAAFRGASRATMDVDLVIAPTASALDDFVQRTAALGLCVSVEAAREAFAHQGAVAPSWRSVHIDPVRAIRTSG